MNNKNKITGEEGAILQETEKNLKKNLIGILREIQEVLHPQNKNRMLCGKNNKGTRTLVN